MKATISPAAYVISLFGGLTATAACLGAPVTTVQGWKERGRIPQGYWMRLMSAAADNGMQLRPEDFLNDHAAVPKRGVAA